MRRFLIGVLVVAILAVAAALIAPGLIDWNTYKTEIVAQVEEATGRKLIIDGDLDFAVLPTPKLSVNDARLANIPGAATPYMARFKALRVNIALLPLFDGRLEVKSVALIDPVIEIEGLADGRRNWEFKALDADPAAKVPDSGAAPSPSQGTTRADTIRLDSLKIENGTLIYRDTASGSLERVQGITAEIAARSLAGPFRAKGKLVARAIPLGFEIETGLLREGRPTPMRLIGRFAGSDAMVEFVGSITNDPAGPQLVGKIVASGSDLTRFVRTLAGPQNASLDLPGWLSQEFKIAAAVTGGTKGVGVNDLTMELGGVRGTGAITLALGARPQLDVALAVTSIDLDRWLGLPRPKSDGKAPAAESAGAAGKADLAAGAGRSNEEADSFALPRDINGSFDLTIGAIAYGGGTLRDARLTASLTEGEVTLSQASVRLPGGGEASLFGFMTAAKGQPKFDGTLEARTDNLRSVFEWLKLDISDLPAERLRKFSLAAKIRGDAKMVQVLDAKLRVDATQVRGGVTVALRKRPSFGARIEIDRLNLDAYLPKKAASGTTLEKTAARTPASGGTARAGVDKPRAGGKASSPLAVLGKFDANLAVHIGTMTYQKTSIRGIAFDGILQTGALTLRNASIENVAGLSVRLNGAANALASKPSFNGGFVAEAKDLSGIVRFAGLDLPVPPRRLGRFAARGRMSGSSDQVKFDSSIEIAGAKVNLAGTADRIDTAPQFDFSARVRHPDFARLVRLLTADFRPARKGLGALALNAKVKGDLKKLDVDTKLDLSGGKMSLSGTVSSLDSLPRFDLAFDASHNDLVRLARGLGADYRPAARLGGFSIGTRIKGDLSSLSLESFRAKAGPTQISGSASVHFALPRPKVLANLSADAIVVDAFLPRETAGNHNRTASGPRAGARRAGGARSAAPSPKSQSNGLSPEPFDFSALTAIDAEIKLAAKAIDYRNYRVAGARATIVLKDGTLAVTEFLGRMFDGAFDMKGRLNAAPGAGKAPAFEGTLAVSNARIGKALLQSGNFSIRSGILDFNAWAQGIG